MTPTACIFLSSLVSIREGKGSSLLLEHYVLSSTSPSHTHLPPTQRPETRYMATEFECQAVVESVRHFEVYLNGHPLTVETDHRALEGLFSSKVLNRKLTGWALYRQEFAMTIRYRPNGNADGLSRQAWISVMEEYEATEDKGRRCRDPHHSTSSHS